MAGEKTDLTHTILPISRIKTIMKSSPDVSAVGNDSLFMITKATEMFVRDLSINCMKNSTNPKNIRYNDLADIVHDDDTLTFLQDIIPKKILAKEFMSSLNNKKEDDDSS